MSESDYIDVLDKPFIYTVGLIIYANSLSGCIQPMSDGMGREFAYLSSHFIPNWGKPRYNIKLAWCYTEVQLILYKDNANRE